MIKVAPIKQPMPISLWLKSWLGILLLLLVYPVMASPLYQVEVIVFKYTRPSKRPEEYWPKNPLWPNISQAVNLLPPLDPAAVIQQKSTTSGDAAPANPALKPDQAQKVSAAVIDDITYHYLPKDQFKLNHQEKKLRRYKRYKVLLHVAWLQSEGSAKMVHLFSGKTYDQGGRRFKSQTNPYQPSPIESNEGLQWELDGTIRVNKSRYFRVSTNLLLTEPNPVPKASWFSRTPDVPPFSRYLLQQTQQMKINELHYFDHPYYGVLVQISSYELPEVENDQKKS